MNNLLLLYLLLSHLLADFFFQTDSLCNDKIVNKFRSKFLYIHSLIAGLLPWLIIFSLDFWKYALIIAISHFIIDAIKVRFNSNLNSFCIDQALHIGIMIWIASIYTFNINYQFLNIQLFNNISFPLLLFVILLCLKPTNIFIKLVLDKYKVGINEECHDIKNAGALIGNLERIISVLFVILGQFEAIGFIVAAKSILRFKDNTAKTEYVLAGTFLSFGIAIIGGLTIKYLSPLIT
jgi:hypothetical protein